MNPAEVTSSPPETSEPCQSCANGSSEVRLVYALGRIHPRFPSVGIEREFAQVAGRSNSSGPDSQVLHAILTKPENQYLARRVCWVFSVQGIETYVLRPRGPQELQVLTETMRSAPKADDLDVVVGTIGSATPAGFCGLPALPQIHAELIYSFDVESFVKSIPCPDKKNEKEFRPAAREVFNRILQLTDNTGATDEHRALNYLAVRYPGVYALAADAFGRNCWLDGVTVKPSLLGGSRRIVEAVFSFTNRSTDVNEKHFVRVDVSEEFPFLVSKMAPFIAR